MYSSSQDSYRDQLSKIQDDGLFKTERVIESPQGSEIIVNGKTVINFCANNYLGLANNERLKNVAKQALDEYGLGVASVRFICGTQTLHKTLEQRISKFLSTDDTILYASCFDANAGLFETLLGENDAIVSDELNHASIIDGIRLCKAKRYRYKHGDMQDLEQQLKAARANQADKIMIASDGVFSMDGAIAKLDEICDLADKYQALVMVDECHATGFFGATGRGAIEYCNVIGRVDIITSTLGKALGGALGGFTTGRKEMIALLRQRSRPYLFSNSLAPAIVAAGIECIDILSESSQIRDKLEKSTHYFRTAMQAAGFNIKSGIHPICPIMLGDAKLASSMADQMLDEGIYVIGFSYPVVPQGLARIRVQISAAHIEQQLQQAVTAFSVVGKRLGVIK